MTVRALLARMCLLSFLAPLGCVSLEKKNAPPPPSTASMVHVLWGNRLMVTQDTVNHGTSLPGLAGRLYLFDSEVGFPLVGDGKVTVDLLDASHPGPDGQPKWLEQFNLDANSLKLLLRKDHLGWGYTLFLPWPNYQPDITRVQLRVCYTPAQGPPLYAQNASVTLRSDDTPTVFREQTVPAGERKK